MNLNDAIESIRNSLRRTMGAGDGYPFQMKQNSGILLLVDEKGRGGGSKVNRTVILVAQISEKS